MALALALALDLGMLEGRLGDEWSDGMAAIGLVSSCWCCWRSWWCWCWSWFDDACEERAGLLRLAREGRREPCEVDALPLMTMTPPPLVEAGVLLPLLLPMLVRMALELALALRLVL